MAEAVWKLICPLSESLAQDLHSARYLLDADWTGETWPCSRVNADRLGGRLWPHPDASSVDCLRVTSLCAADQVAPGRRQQARPIGPVGVGLVVFASSGRRIMAVFIGPQSTVVSRPQSDRIA